MQQEIKTTVKVKNGYKIVRLIKRMSRKVTKYRYSFFSLSP